MESITAWAVLSLIINVLIMIIAFFGGNLIKGMQTDIKTADEKTSLSFQRIFDKLEGYQTIKGCLLAHENHDKIHDIEKNNYKEKMDGIRTQIDNVANIARSKVSRTHIE